jgi:hypothetical protein
VQRGIDDIKSHPFFASLDFNLIIQKKTSPPFKPNLTNKMDVKYFDDKYTQENIVESYMPQTSIDYIKQNEKQFEQFNH